MGVLDKAKMRLGGGGRFKKLAHTLAERPGARNPNALAAAIGRKKYGNRRFGRLSQGGS